MKTKEKFYKMHKMSDKLYDYLFDQTQRAIEISKRKYDGMFNVWQLCVVLNKDNTWNRYWQVVGVFEKQNEALDFVEEFLKR